MSAVAEAATRLRQIAEPRPVGDSVKAAITRAAVRVGIPAERAKALWYGEARLVRAEEMDAIRLADQARHDKENAAREQAERLGEIFAAVASRLSETDADGHRNDIAALVEAARRLGAGDSPLAAPEGE